MRLALATVAAIAACASQPAPRAVPARTADPQPAATATGYRAVPPFELDAALLEGAMPRLPDALRLRRAGAGELRGAYMIYVGQNGNVERVEVVTPIAGADGTIVAQLKTWRYKPQPRPIRSLLTFVYSLR